jgi:hypothetical protein
MVSTERERRPVGIDHLTVVPAGDDERSDEAGAADE